jgi:hypothetical protein
VDWKLPLKQASIMSTCGANRRVDHVLEGDSDVQWECFCGATRMCPWCMNRAYWWPNLAGLGKLDYLVWEIGLSGFGSFIIESRKKFKWGNVKIQVYLRHGKGKEGVRVLYPGYRGQPVTAHNSRYVRFPPTTNGWGTTHPIPDMARPLLAEEEGSLT